MKISFMILLSIVFLSNTVYSQTAPTTTPTPTVETTNQNDDELKKLYQDLQKKQSDLEKRQREYEESLKVISTSRNEKSGQIQTLDQRIAEIETRYQKLNEIVEQRKENESLTKKIQARTILDSYKRVIGDSRNMAFAFGFVKTNSSLQEKINPINNATFKKELNSLKNKLGDNEKNLISDNPVFKNPFVSIALSIGSLLVSNFSGNEKLNKFKNMVCILDISIKISPRVEKFQYDLNVIKLGVDTFEKETETEFVEFIQRVTGNKNFTKYEDLDNAGFTDDKLEEAIEKYLNAPNNSGKIDRENIKIRMDEYTSILNQTNNLLIALDDTFKDISINLTQSVCNLPLGKEMANDFKNEIDTAKIDSENNKKQLMKIVSSYKNFLRVRKQILSESY